MRSSPSNDWLCDALVSSGAISTPSVVAAFRATDRGHFLNVGEGGGVAEADAYTDMPLRQGVLHLSAPSIYGTALEFLDLQPGHSFLNIGSGTGYLSALAATILGPRAVQFGVECRAELVSHARSKLDALGHHHVQIVHSNAFSLDPEGSMRFERIYVGAGASARTAALLFRMLEIGGVIVGPFAGAHGTQRLLKATRTAEDKFDVQEVLSVQFTPLLPPAPHAAYHLAYHYSPPPPPRGPHSKSNSQAEPPVRLIAPLWSPEEHLRFDTAHKDAVYTALLMHNREDTLFSTLPKEVLLQELLPHLPYGSFPRAAALRAAAAAAPSSSSSNPTTPTSPATPQCFRRARGGIGGLLACVSGGSAHDDDEDEADAMQEPTTETGRLSASWVSHVASAAARAVAGGNVDEHGRVGSPGGLFTPHGHFTWGPHHILNGPMVEESDEDDEEDEEEEEEEAEEEEEGNESSDDELPNHHHNHHHHSHHHHALSSSSSSSPTIMPLLVHTAPLASFEHLQRASPSPTANNASASASSSAAAEMTRDASPLTLLRRANSPTHHNTSSSASSSSSSSLIDAITATATDGTDGSTHSVGSSSRIAALRRARVLRRILTRLLRDGASKAGLALGTTSSSPRNEQQSRPQSV